MSICKTSVVHCSRMIELHECLLIEVFCFVVLFLVLNIHFVCAG